jgi:hypothetical protein
VALAQVLSVPCVPLMPARMRVSTFIVCSYSGRFAVSGSSVPAFSFVLTFMPMLRGSLFVLAAPI